MLPSLNEFHDGRDMGLKRSIYNYLTTSVKYIWRFMYTKFLKNVKGVRLETLTSFALHHLTLKF